MVSMAIKSGKLVHDKFLIWLSIIFVLCTLHLAVSIDKHDAKMEAHQGILDLTGWDFLKDGIVKLNGEWEIYPNQLLEPQDFAIDKVEPRTYIFVPSTWNPAKTEQGQPLGSYGYATYRLQVKLDAGSPPLAIRTIDISLADRFYIDGELLDSLGKVGTSKEDYMPDKSPQLIMIDKPGSQMEIVIQVANYHAYLAGIQLPVYFGYSKDVARSKYLQNALETGAATVFFMLGTLFLIVFTFFHRDRSFLIFGAFFICFMLLTLLTGEKMLYQFYPAAPVHLFTKIKDLSEYALTILISIFTWSMYKSWKYDKIFLIPAILYGAYCLVILLLPFEFYQFAAGVCYQSLVIAYMLLIVVLLRQYETEDYGSFGKSALQLYMIALFCMALMFQDSYFFYYTNQKDARTIGHFAVFVFMQLITVILAQRYFQMYTALQRLTQNLQATYRAKDEFLLRTSHELNAPLHGIINLSQVMLEETELGETTSMRKSKDKLEFIRSTAYRMSNLVNDIIDLARIKDGRLDMKLTAVDLAACVSIVFEVFTFSARGKNVQLINKIGSGARYVIADESRLMQVLHNLIDNCLKHTHRGSVRISSRAEHGLVIITVEDAGEGFAPEQRNAIFSSDEELGNDGPDLEGSGFGLGLSVAQELVGLMHGTIALSGPEENLGSRFEMTFPSQVFDMEEDGPELMAPNVLAAEDLLPMSQDAETEGEYTVLVVDDESLQIELLVNILAVEGYKVISARSKEEALSKTAQFHKPDIMLLDVMMSGGSGYEVSREVRKLYSSADLPILFVTVRNTPADVEAGLAAGGNDFLTKPFDNGEVRARIRTLLAMKRLAKEAALNEMAFLQSQIKPHFLYNALSTIMALCYTDGPRAGELLGIFSKYLRIIFHLDNTEETVEVRKEVELVSAYVEIEKVRFGERVQVMFNIDEQLLHYKIMLLTIQPLVENAIRHGVAKKIDGGTVKLMITRQNDTIRITVEDDGVGMSAQQLQEITAYDKPLYGVGFANISRRMMHLTGKPPVLESAPDKGTRVTLWIPIIE
jgi:two-component system sensor histidine kinase ChiS